MSIYSIHFCLLLVTKSHMLLRSLLINICTKGVIVNKCSVNNKQSIFSPSKIVHEFINIIRIINEENEKAFFSLLFSAETASYNLNPRWHLTIHKPKLPLNPVFHIVMKKYFALITIVYTIDLRKSSLRVIIFFQLFSSVIYQKGSILIMLYIGSGKKKWSILVL